jgi:hypothetical protein
MCHTWGKRIMHKGFLLENVKERDCLEGLGINVRIILKWTLNRIGGCGLDSSGS